MQQHHQSLLDIFDGIFSTPNEKTSAFIAAGMISSPFWSNYLKEISEIAALLGPILGVVYLTIQIAYKIVQFCDKDDE